MIGGEFPIAVSGILNSEVRKAHLPDVYAYSSGRAALYQILEFLKREKSIKRILLPDYLCSSLLVPIKALGLDFEFYPIDDNLKLEATAFFDLFRCDDAVLIINYFGLQDLSDSISTIRNLDDKAIIIEDDVQAYYEFRKPLDEVDFKFTSLRKTFAVPDGGLVKTDFELHRVNMPNTFGQYKAAAALLKSMREDSFNDQIYLEMFEKGENLINGELECGMSRIAEKLYGSLNEEHVKMRRLNNAQYLIEGLNKLGVAPLLPLSDNHVPLFIPIFLENRNDVRERMFQNEVFCPVHWPLEGMDMKKGKEMAEHELSLIIDQRYNIADMDLILSLL